MTPWRGSIVRSVPDRAPQLVLWPAAESDGSAPVAAPITCGAWESKTLLLWPAVFSDGRERSSGPAEVAGFVLDRSQAVDLLSDWSRRRFDGNEPLGDAVRSLIDLHVLACCLLAEGIVDASDLSRVRVVQTTARRLPLVSFAPSTERPAPLSWADTASFVRELTNELSVRARLAAAATSRLRETA